MCGRPTHASARLSRAVSPRAWQGAEPAVSAHFMGERFVDEDSEPQRLMSKGVVMSKGARHHGGAAKARGAKKAKRGAKAADAKKPRGFG